MILDQIKRWVDDRFQWEFLKQKVIEKPLSKDIGWWYTLGSICLFLLVVQVLTGILLACNYDATLEGAYRSTEYIQNEMIGGWLIRGMHHWGSNLMVITVFIHMMRAFFHGGYKKPNEVTWIAGVFLMLLTVGMAFTGYILPWSDISYWAVTIGATTLEYFPYVGSWILNIMGGKQIGGITIGRYATFHMLLIPIMLAGFAGLHILLIQIHGEKGPPRKDDKDVGTQPFYPYQLAKDVVVCIIFLIVLIVLAKFVGLPESKPASPLASIDSVPKPEWFILFYYELLKMFEGKWIIIALTILPAAGISVLIFLPFYDRNEETAYLKRPIAISIGVAALVVVGYLTLIAHISTPLPGKFFAPDRSLKLNELAGMSLFEKNVCYCCHSIKGIGMKHAPDLWKVGTKRDKKYVTELLKDPDKVLGKGKMVKYYIDKYDIDALASYILSIDFMKYNEKIIEPPVYRGSYMLYREHISQILKKEGADKGKDDVTISYSKKSEEDIVNILKQNMQKLVAKTSVKEISNNEIARIAKYLSTLK